MGNGRERSGGGGVVSFGEIIRGVVFWTLAFELLTLVLRFGFSLESTRDTASTVGYLTSGVRVHHGYVGVYWERRLAAVGGGLLASDLVHHFVVLWLLTGSPQFDLFY
jgi:hypothetical protein